MHKFKVWIRYPNGSTGFAQITASNSIDATQQAYMMYGRANVISVMQDD